MKQICSFTALAAACVLGFGSTASAQDLITWEPGVDLFSTGDNGDFVSDNGTSVMALNGTNPANSAVGVDGVPGALASITVNGTDFVGVSQVDILAGVTQNGVTFTADLPDGNSLGGNQGALDNGIPFFTDQGAIDLLAGQVFHFSDAGVIGGEEGTVTFSGLTVGDTYEIQMLVNDSRPSRDGPNTTIFSDGVNDILTSLENGTAGLGELNNFTDNIINPASVVDPAVRVGDSVTGTFTATTDSQSFAIQGTTNIFPDIDPVTGEPGPVIYNRSPAAFNALQLRNISNVGPVVILGDCDMNGVVNFLDIAPFISILSGTTFVAQADCNEDGEISFLDIAPFITILAGS